MPADPPYPEPLPYGEPEYPAGAVEVPAPEEPEEPEESEDDEDRLDSQLFGPVKALQAPRPRSSVLPNADAAAEPKRSAVEESRSAVEENVDDEDGSPWPLPAPWLAETAVSARVVAVVLASKRLASTRLVSARPASAPPASAPRVLAPPGVVVVVLAMWARDQTSDLVLPTSSAGNGTLFRSGGEAGDAVDDAGAVGDAEEDNGVKTDGETGEGLGAGDADELAELPELESPEDGVDE